LQVDADVLPAGEIHCPSSGICNPVRTEHLSAAGYHVAEDELADWDEFSGGQAETVTVTIRRALASDIEPAVAVLVAGFFSDPVLVWLVPEERARRRFLRGLFHAAAEDSHRSGELRVAVDEGEVCGTAVWYPPGHVPESGGTEMEGALAALEDADLDRFAALREATVDHDPVEPHFYLWLMAVAGEKQGAGIGGGLLTVVLDICDERQTVAHLEATRSENRRLYERYGFEATGEIRLPEGPTKWPMTRPPQGQP